MKIEHKAQTGDEFEIADDKISIYSADGEPSQGVAHVSLAGLLRFLLDEVVLCGNCKHWENTSEYRHGEKRCTLLTVRDGSLLNDPYGGGSSLHTSPSQGCNYFEQKEGGS